jgi:hypothetical protein
METIPAVTFTLDEKAYVYSPIDATLRTHPAVA